MRALPAEDTSESSSEPVRSSDFATTFSQIISFQLMVSYGGVSAWTSLRGETELGNTEIALAALAGDVLQLAFVILVIRQRMPSVLSLDEARFDSSSWAQGAASAVASIASIALLQTLIQTTEASSHQAVASLVGDQTNLGTSALVLSNIVIGPVTEEIVWRALLLHSLVKWTSNLAGSILISSIAFAAWHLDSQNFLSLGVLGGWLGFVYLRSGLSASIFAHSLFNAFSLATLELS